jgi:1A family penicillin-binding protein
VNAEIVGVTAHPIFTISMWNENYRSKPLYKRWWFITLLLLILIPTILICGLIWKVKVEYEGRAEKFDMKELEQMESASVILDRNGKILGRIYIQNRDMVPLDQFPQVMIEAVVAAEDNRFFSHHGVDYFGIVRAALKNYRAGEIRQGASTLTQQLARNTFSLTERSYDRKILEVFLAREIEKKVPKNKILELYLNRVYFGSGFYGAEAASRGYFGKPARNLSVDEAAMLAGLLKSPNNLSPWSNRRACIDQRNFVLERMRDLGFIDEAGFNRAINTTLIVKNRKALHAQSYALDYVRQQVIAEVGYENAVSEGYRIYTTLDADLQKTAEESLNRRLTQIESRPDWNHQTYREYDGVARAHERQKSENDLAPPKYLQGAVVVMNNETGGVLAMVGGRDFNHSQYNRAVLAARPPGTAFKPIVYAAAFEQGMYPGTVTEDAVMDNRQVMIGGTTGILGEWGPESIDNRYEGVITAREALVKSKNAATVRLGMRVGLGPILKLAKKAGISTTLRSYPATILGSSEVTLMDLTLAYTTFARDGTRPARPVIVKKIEKKSGETVVSEKLQAVSVMHDSTAYEVNSILGEVLERGTADVAFSRYGLRKFPLGGKTGTAYNFTDDWFLGYSSAITCGVWVGFDAPRTPIYRGAFSNEIALPIWVDVMNATFDRYIPREIEKPNTVKRYEICSLSGELATEKCLEHYDNPNTGESIDRSTTYFDLATEEQAPKFPCSIHTDSVHGFVKNVPKGQWPRARAAADLAALIPVRMKAPTVIGPEDPYNSGSTVISADATANPFGNGEAPRGEKPDEKKVEVRRPEPIRPLDLPDDKPLIDLPPPPPLKF